MKAKDLKNAILQMAVQGALVPQDPSDEPASALLGRIREERANLIKEKKIKAPKGGESVIYRAEDGSYYEKRIDAKGRESEPVCIDDEIPFDIPETWEWVRLGGVLNVISDGAHKTPTYVNEGIPFLSVQNISQGFFDLSKVKYIREEEHQELCKRIAPRQGDILLCRIGTLGKAIIVTLDFEFSIFVSLGLLRATDQKLNQWIVESINSPMGTNWIQNVKVGGGTHTFKINLGDIPSFLLPIPPLAEQHRIVGRVAELMPLVEEYGKLEDAREKLDAELPDRLRKSVLQMAVQGALVPQDPSDEPASALLERIREERAELIREKNIKAPKGGESVIYRAEDGSYCEKRIDAKGRESEPACIDDEIPFDIPETWEWVRLCDLASFAGGKTPATNDKSNYADNGILWVTSKDMKRDYIDSTLITLSEKGASDLTIFSPGTIIMVTRSGILRRMLPVAILKAHATVNQDQKAICPFDTSISIWLLVFLKASDAYIRQNFSKAGTTVESIVFDKVKTQPIPVPPLTEQHRIVERVAELMPLIEGFGKLDSYHN